MAERVRKYIALKAKAGNVPVTASLGIASWPAEGITANGIIAAADAALYHAKRSGGNQIHCASGMLLPLDEVPASTTSQGDDGALSTIYSLATTVDMRNHHSSQHSKKVSEYALALARALNLKQADAGNKFTHPISISDEILHKPGKLTDKEWEIVKEHPRLSATIANRVRKLVPCVPGILYHHEGYDGGGYPEGLKGEDIPLDARILAIADAFVAMTSYRPYAAVLSEEQAQEEIRRGAGTQFDPHLVGLFLR